MALGSALACLGELLMVVSCLVGLYSFPPPWDFLSGFVTELLAGLGDALAEGGWAAARRLGLGEDLARQRYPGRGYAAHCDPFGWGEIFNDQVLATAILDRLLHHCTTLNIKGESYRLKEKRRAGLLEQPKAADEEEKEVAIDN